MASCPTDETIITSDATTLANSTLTHVKDDGTIDLDFARKAKKGEHPPTPEHIAAAKTFRERTPHAVIKPREDMIQSLRERAKSPDKPKIANDNGFAEELSTFNKVNGALSLVGAGMSAIGAYQGFRNSVAQDEQGKSHIQWTPLGFAILNSAFAVGCAYLSYHCFKGTGRAS